MTDAIGPPEAEAGGILTIDLAAIVANWRALSERAAPAQCAAVVKADGYGCGAEQVAGALAKAGCTTFFVANLPEARRARAAAPDATIYVLNGVLPGTAAAFAHANLRPVIGDWLGWRSVFWVLAAIYVTAGGALFGVMRAHPAVARPASGHQGSMIGQMIAVLRRRWVITVVLVVALEGGTFWGAFTFVGADLHQRFDMGFAAIGLAVAAFGAGGFSYVLVAPQLVRLLGERGLCIWGGLGLGAAFAIMALAPSAEVEFAGIMLSGVSFYMLHNTLQTHGTQMAPEARGAAMALFALCLFVGQAIGVPLAAPIVDRWGAVPIFWAAALFLPALALFFAVSLRRRRA